MDHTLKLFFFLKKKGELCVNFLPKRRREPLVPLFRRFHRDHLDRKDVIVVESHRSPFILRDRFFTSDVFDVDVALIGIEHGYAIIIAAARVQQNVQKILRQVQAPVDRVSPEAPALRRRRSLRRYRRRGRALRSRLIGVVRSF